MFWCNEMFQDHLVYTLLRPGIEHFFEVPFSGESEHHFKERIFSDPPGSLKCWASALETASGLGDEFWIKLKLRALEERQV